MIKAKGIIALGLILIILVTAGYIYKNKDELFTQHAEIRYPDGCVEKYVNYELVSPVCIQPEPYVPKKDYGFDLNFSVDDFD